VTYDLEIPQQILDNPCGLILDVHGGGMTADTENDGTNMRELGKQYGYVILQPSMPNGMVTIAYDKTVFNVVYLIMDELNIDEDRIHVMGFSMGGAFVWRALRDHSDMLASIAPLSTGAGTEDIRYVPSWDNMPEYEIPIISVLGRNDPIVPPETRGMPLWNAILEVWNMGPALVIAGDDTYTHYRYTNANGTILEFLMHDYVSNAPVGAGIAGGHCFPGSDAHYDPLNPSRYIPYGCEGENSFNIGEEVMKFFIEHPKS
jgi:pimeloyl-ACP methyl ester carboxylesterase